MLPFLLYIQQQKILQNQTLFKSLKTPKKFYRNKPKKQKIHSKHYANNPKSQKSLPFFFQNYFGRTEFGHLFVHF